jgi:hypothetical protein
MPGEKEMSVDPQVYELAEHFLPHGSDENKQSLAIDIQSAVEDWFSFPPNPKPTP